MVGDSTNIDLKETSALYISIVACECLVGTGAGEWVWMSKRGEKNIDFDRVLEDAIDQSLSMVDKTRRKRLVLHLQELGIKKENIVFSIAEFSMAVEHVLGPDAFNFKTRLLNEIQRRLDEGHGSKKIFDCLVPNLTFEEYIQVKQLISLLSQMNSSRRSPNFVSTLPIKQA